MKNKKFAVEPATQPTLFGKISNTENDANCADSSHGYITYYGCDGTFQSKETLNKENIGEIAGEMVRCTMNNGDAF